VENILTHSLTHTLTHIHSHTHTPSCVSDSTLVNKKHSDSASLHQGSSNANVNVTWAAANTVNYWRSHTAPVHRISSTFINLLSHPTNIQTDWQTDRQTDAQWHVCSLAD